LFETDSASKNISAIAFGATGEEFLAWKAHLENQGLELRIADHKLAYSLYFSDPWGNYHEITTYERDHVAKQLS
jgi:catechol-2,3-dioxygenase